MMINYRFSEEKRGPRFSKFGRSPALAVGRDPHPSGARGSNAWPPARRPTRRDRFPSDFCGTRCTRAPHIRNRSPAERNDEVNTRRKPPARNGGNGAALDPFGAGQTFREGSKRTGGCIFGTYSTRSIRKSVKNNDIR